VEIWWQGFGFNLQLPSRICIYSSQLVVFITSLAQVLDFVFVF